MFLTVFWPGIQVSFPLTLCASVVKLLFFMDVMELHQEAVNHQGTRVYWHVLALNTTPKLHCNLQENTVEYIFLLLSFGLFSSFRYTSPNVFGSHWKPTSVCICGFAMSSWKKAHSVLGKGRLFARNIVCSDFVLQYHRLCSILLHLFHIWTFHTQSPSRWFEGNSITQRAVHSLQYHYLFS